MSRNPRRSLLVPAYVLAHQPYRDTSRILEVLTREQGRLSVFARGVRGPGSRLGPLLQPFRPLLLSFSNRGDAGQLTGAESAGYLPELPPRCLMSGFYLNELLLKLTTRHDPHPQLFDAYQEALDALRAGAEPQRPLRLFEKQLLQEIGYGLQLARDASGKPVEAGSYYHFRPMQGLAAVAQAAGDALAGGSLLSLEAGELATQRHLNDARRLLAAALASCLEGRQIITRSVARACRSAGGPGRGGSIGPSGPSGSIGPSGPSGPGPGGSIGSA